MKVVIVTVIVAAILVGASFVWLFAKNSAAQPTHLDYLKLENQREVADISIGAYDPILEDFASRYRIAYMEEFSGDEKAAIKNDFSEQFDAEAELSEHRFDEMDASIALKDDAVQAKYRQFSNDYRAMVGYFRLYKSTATQIIEAVSGSCKKVTRLDIGSDDYPKNFVNTSQKCLDTLAAAKKHSTPSARIMIAGLENMYKTRQDAFKKVVNEKDKIERFGLQATALISLLDINMELAKLQADYQAAETKEYEATKNAVNQSNQALRSILELKSDAPSSQSEEK